MEPPGLTNYAASLQSAEVLLPCQNLSETLDFFNTQFGFRVDAIFPADHPVVAVISGFGIRIRLQQGLALGPGHLRFAIQNGPSQTIEAPNGTRIELVPSDPPLILPPLHPSFVLNQIVAGDGWHIGRAGMRYRDLIPGRQGGRLIASHIQIEKAGPVADYVHFHKVRFQLIYCLKGWVKLVYEDQGPPFLLQPSECVLQPPQIRHRVLECSAGLEVVEIGCPADHETFADHDMPLPTEKLDPQRLFSSQSFVHHRLAHAEWIGNDAGFDTRDLGLARSTNDLLSAQVVRARTLQQTYSLKHHGEFLFLYVISGRMRLSGPGLDSQALNPDDSCVIPPNDPYELRPLQAGSEWMEVTCANSPARNM